MAFTMVTVTGTFQTPEGGEPIKGQVTATLQRTLRNGTVQALADPVIGILDGTGALKLQNGQPFVLPATDDAGTTPTGVFYEWVIELGNSPLLRFMAPLSKAVNPVDLSTLEPNAL